MQKNISNHNSKNKINNFNEKLFCLYVYIFTIMSGIIYLAPQFSFILLFLVVLGMVVVSLFFNKLKFKNFKPFMLMSFSILFIFLLEAIFKFNNYIYEYTYYFILFGIIPVYFYSQTIDIEVILKTYVKLSLIVFFMYFWDPFVGYKIFNDYMSFGFNFALPIFCGLYLGRKYFNYKNLIIFELFIFFELLVFSNKGAALAGILFVLLYNVFITKWSIKHIFFVLIILIICLIVLFNILNILDKIIILLDSIGMRSYSIETLRRVILTQDYVIGLANRDIIWNNALYYFKQHPLVGLGTGGFQALTGTYSHNFLIDILVQYGIVGLFLFVVAVLKSFVAIFYKTSIKYKTFGILMFCLWFISLSTSMIFYKSLYFWIFIFFGFTKKHKWNSKNAVTEGGSIYESVVPKL